MRRRKRIKGEEKDTCVIFIWNATYYKFRLFHSLTISIPITDYVGRGFVSSVIRAVVHRSRHPVQTTSRSLPVHPYSWLQTVQRSLLSVRIGNKDSPSHADNSWLIALWQSPTLPPPLGSNTWNGKRRNYVLNAMIYIHFIILNGAYIYIPYRDYWFIDHKLKSENASRVGE